MTDSNKNILNEVQGDPHTIGGRTDAPVNKTSDLLNLPDDELLTELLYPKTVSRQDNAAAELRRRLADLRAERDEAREKVRLHVECMCGHLIEDHDYDEGHGECTEFGTGSGGGEVECFCENFRPAWAEWWKRADEAVSQRDSLIAVMEVALAQLGNGRAVYPAPVEAAVETIRAALAKAKGEA